MPGTQAVAAAIQAIINPVVTDLIVDNNPVAVITGIGWPSVKSLQNNVKGSNSLVSIYDRKLARNTTRWNPANLVSAGNSTLLTTSISNSTIAATMQQTITLGGSVSNGDAVSAIAINSEILPSTIPTGRTVATNAAAQVALGVAGMTLAQLATTLASQINADPVMNLWMTASATGAVVTISSLLSVGTITLQSNAGNGGTSIREIGRRERHYQVVVWSPTSDIRSAITDAIETVLQQTETLNWVQFSDNTVGRLFNQNDFDLEDATLADTYRHDFLFSVDYPITEIDILYSVLAPIAQYTL